MFSMLQTVFLFFILANRGDIEFVIDRTKYQNSIYKKL